MRAHVIIVIMQGSPIGFFNPVTPRDLNFPVHTAHPVPWVLSIPNLALILLSNPKSRPSNEEKPASRETCWGPYTVAFCHGSHVDRKIYLLDNLLYMIYISSYFLVLICLGWNRRLISYLQL